MEKSKKIKILHFRSSSGIYGAENVILTIAKELDRKGCDNHIVCINSVYNPHSELVDEAKKLGISATSVDSMGPLDWECIKELRHMIKDEQFDVLHFHDYKASVYGFLASWWMAPKRVVTNHLWDNIDWKLWIYQRLEGFLYNKFDRIVAVSERVKRDIRPFIIHKSKIEVITNGIDVAQFAQRSIPENGERRTENGEIQNPSSCGCKCAQTLVRTKFCLKEDDFVVGIVGRLAKQKDHATLLKAFSMLLAKENGERKTENGMEDPSSVIRHPLSLKLLIVGDGPLENSLKALCRELDLNFIDTRTVDNPLSVIGSPYSVIFAGVRTDMPDVYSVMDVLAMPSLQEGLPMVLLEAMVSGVPVVATPVGQIPRIIKHGETGFLVEKRDIVGLAEALGNILENGVWSTESGESQSPSSVIRHSLSLQEITANAKKLVIERHSSAAMADQYLETYEWLVE